MRAPLPSLLLLHWLNLLVVFSQFFVQFNLTSFLKLVLRTRILSHLVYQHVSYLKPLLHHLLSLTIVFRLLQTHFLLIRILNQKPFFMYCVQGKDAETIQKCRCHSGHCKGLLVWVGKRVWRSSLELAFWWLPPDWLSLMGKEIRSPWEWSAPTLRRVNDFILIRSYNITRALIN